MRKTSDALKILDRMTGPSKRLRQRIEEATLNARVAEMIYEARTKAGLSQQALADLVGPKQPVIAASRMRTTKVTPSACWPSLPRHSIASSTSVSSRQSGEPPRNRPRML